MNKSGFSKIPYCVYCKSPSISSYCLDCSI